MNRSDWKKIEHIEERCKAGFVTTQTQVLWLIEKAREHSRAYHALKAIRVWFRQRRGQMIIVPSINNKTDGKG